MKPVCEVLTVYLWRYVTVDLFGFLDLLRLSLHRRVVLLLFLSHGRPPLRSQQRGGRQLPRGTAVVPTVVKVRLKVDAYARSGDVLLHKGLLILCNMKRHSITF